MVAERTATDAPRAESRERRRTAPTPPWLGIEIDETALVKPLLHVE